MTDAIAHAHDQAAADGADVAGYEVIDHVSSPTATHVRLARASQS